MNIKEIEKAQNKWGKGIIKIGELRNSFKECRMFTLDFISKMYDYNNGIVQFKPTKASDNQFRGDMNSALSYFIGSDNKFSEDKGFALNPWVKVDFENDSINIILNKYVDYFVIVESIYNHRGEKRNYRGACRLCTVSAR